MDPHDRRRRGRQRRRRTDDRGRAGRRRPPRSPSSPRARSATAAPPGPRAGWPPSSGPTTTPSCTCRTRSSPVPASATRRPSAPSSTRHRPPSPLLQQLGARLDLDVRGRPALTREGGHSRDRIVHAGGDASGAEVTRTLGRRAARPRHRGPRAHRRAGRAARRRRPGRRPAGRPRSGTTARSSTPVTCAPAPRCSRPAATARSSPRRPTPPAPPATGWPSRCAPGPRSPTSRWCSSTPPCSGPAPAPTGQQALISEAVRGEGAVLVDRDGRRIMLGAHPLADLAPRDVVSATIAAHLRATGDDHVFLDATHLGADFLRRRFPGIVRACREAGFDLTREPVPVVPAAHYSCGGVVADLDGAHRRRRASSPSARSPAPASRAPTGWPPTRSPRASSPPAAAPPCSPPTCPRSPTRSRARAARRSTPPPGTTITAATTRDAGRPPRRRRASRGWPASWPPSPGCRPAAGPGRRRDDGAAHGRHPARRRGGRARTESRGCHRRADVPATRPEWEVRLVHRLDDAGRLQHPHRARPHAGRSA